MSGPAVSLTSIILGCVVLLLLAACNSSASGPGRKLTSTEARGKRTFDAYCVSCHDAFSTSPRQGPGLKGLYKKQYLPSGLPSNDEHVRNTIILGRNNMPPFDKVLDADQVDRVIAYLHTL